MIYELHGFVTFVVDRETDTQTDRYSVNNKWFTTFYRCRTELRLVQGHRNIWLWITAASLRELKVGGGNAFNLRIGYSVMYHKLLCVKLPLRHHCMSVFSNYIFLVHVQITLLLKYLIYSNSGLSWLSEVAFVGSHIF